MVGLELRSVSKNGISVRILDDSLLSSTLSGSSIVRALEKTADSQELTQGLALPGLVVGNSTVCPQSRGLLSALLS